MKLNLFSIISIILLFVSGCGDDPDITYFTPEQNEFEMLYNLGDKSFGTGVVKTVDNKFVLFGTAHISTVKYRFLLQTNNEGTLEWQKIYDSPGGAIASNLIYSDNKFYTLSTITLDNTKQIYVARYDTAGILLNEKYVASSKNDSAVTSLLTVQNELIIVGRREDKIMFPVIIKTDLNLNVLWETEISISEDNYPVGIVEISDGYIIAANNYDEKGEHTGINLFIISSDGKFKRKHKINDSNALIASDVVTDGYGGVVITANKRINNSLKNDIIIFRINNAGEIITIYQNIELGSQNSVSLTKTTDGGYLITGFEADLFQTDLLLLKFDEGLAKEWERMYDKQSNEIGNDAYQISTGYAVIGTSGKGVNNSVYFLKTDYNGLIN